MASRDSHHANFPHQYVQHFSTNALVTWHARGCTSRIFGQDLRNARSSACILYSSLLFVSLLHFVGSTSIATESRVPCFSEVFFCLHSGLHSGSLPNPRASNGSPGLRIQEVRIAVLVQCCSFIAR